MPRRSPPRSPAAVAGGGVRRGEAVQHAPEDPLPGSGPHLRGEATALYRAGGRGPLPPVLAGLRRLQRMPGPRLTALGCGLLGIVTMLAVGTLDWLLLDASPAAYGLPFLVVCAACALWVSPSDLITAPISAPIAFAVGLLPIGCGSGGFGSQVVGMFTQLALHAGWLYGGTFVAVLVVIGRKVLMISDKAARQAAARRAGQEPEKGVQRV